MSDVYEVRFARLKAEGVPTPPARVGGGLVCAGATMTFVLGLTSSGYSNGHPAATLIPSAFAFLFGLACLIAGRATPRWLVSLMPAVAGTLILLSMWMTDTPIDGSELLFVWCIFFAGYFLPTMAAAANTGYISVGYATVAIGKRGLSAGLPPVIYLTTTLVVACYLIIALRRRAAASLDQARAEARTDHLTGLLNRRGLGEVSEREVERAQRDGRPLSAWMVDLDHFKGLNDTLGHAAGDRALEGVAEVLRDQLRGIDVIARVGGEEFCVLLPNCTTAAAFLRAEAVREAVAETFRARGLPVTVSIGVATWTSGDLDGSTLTAAADQALYAAKSGGRNQTQVAHGLPSPRLAIAEAG
jgi:diguanylate cyclase (GGDEF)-like protein